jgi:hypothetical protein
MCQAEMSGGVGRCHPATFGSLDESDFEQIWFHHVYQRIDFFAECRG